eukprot:TRINITY_DN54_c0_g1_i2.p1 TRINITY_DN54_c0_g1~~TRINITY_DN54_c0_g1_i2.p1  ORF type:complete len:179 (-),score=61.08 TRINITY_DN54_c0_g1_i2:93-629(-)
MVKVYSRKPQNAEKAVRSSGANIRVHFKNTYETANAIRGMKLKQARGYLKDVMAHKQAVPFFRFTGGLSRHAQAKRWGTNVCRWPVNSCKALLTLIDNALANAKAKSLDESKLTINHIQVNQAPKGRRRTYRAHGRINASCPTPATSSSSLRLVRPTSRRPLPPLRPRRGPSAFSAVS